VPAFVLAKSVKPTALAPTIAMGFWQHPTTVSLNTPDDVVVDAASVSAGAGGTYKLHVLSAVSNAELAIDAEYQSGAAHRFWQSWSEGGLLQKSPTSAIRWWAKDRRALQLTIWSGGAASVTQLPARAGTYVLDSASVVVRVVIGGDVIGASYHGLGANAGVLEITDYGSVDGHIEGTVWFNAGQEGYYAQASSMVREFKSGHFRATVVKGYDY